jgi:4-methyl-5(b-hydroxyethyl)-thiazole monophosphate biosynthesis
MPRVVVPLAPGFEEIEAVSIIDVLRRGGVEVVVAALEEHGSVEGSHGIAVQTDATLAQLDAADFDLIILPGGEPGTTHLGASDLLARWLDDFVAAGKPLAAICAAPRVLAARGFLRGLAATSHPSVEDAVRQAGATYRDARVVRSGSIVTSRGPGTALEFSLEVLSVLGLQSEATRLRHAMLVASSASP